MLPSLATSSPREDLLGKGQPQKAALPRAPTPWLWRCDCCYRNTGRTHGAEIKHPSGTGLRLLGLLSWSPWQHAGSREASNSSGEGILTPSRGSGRRAAGRAAAWLTGAAHICRSLVVWPARCAAREVEPGASPLPARTLSSPRGLKVNAQALSAPSLRIKREAIG